MNHVTTRKAGSTSPLRQQIGRQVGDRLDRIPGMRRAKLPAAQIYYMPNYLSDADCSTLIRLIDADRRPSTLMSTSNDPYFRNSESCDLNRWAPEVLPIDTRIADLLGIPKENGETIQGQRYAPGQQFRAHHDYFHESESYWEEMKKHGGQRTWTAMIFLNEVEEGGATWFPQAGARFPPRKGTLLVWNNMNPDGSPNDATLHEGTAVLKGVKYIITKWFRERPWI